MTKYIFLYSWASGSDMACGEDTGVDSYHDLLPEFRKGNAHVCVVCIEAETAEIAEAYGKANMFDNEYSPRDCVFGLWKDNDCGDWVHVM